MDKKILRWNFVFQYGYVLTNIFNSILLLPLYLKHIDASTLGIWLATGNVLGWITLVDPGVGEVLQQKIAELRGKKENDEIGKLIGSGFIASAIILLISVAFGFVCYLFLGAIINKDISQYPHLSMAIIITVFSTGMSLVSFSMSGINQGMHNSAPVAISSVSANFLFLFVNLLFLYLGFGVMSIAIANLFRGVFINVYTISSLLRLLKKEGLKLVYDMPYFKGFIKIFSFTSVSKIITGISYSVDMIVLARYIAPANITIYEINRRPINISYSLVGRHSVALMPLLSHAQGRGDKAYILNLINNQFKFYSYAAMFVALIFFFNYNYLITAWTGKGQYAGNTIVHLLIINFFIGLLAYFMLNMGYALGDIKMNSLFNIVRSLCYGVFIFFAAKYFGITGTLVVVFFISLMDLIFYNIRIYKLGYFDAAFFKTCARLWLIIVPSSFVAGWGLKLLVEDFVPDQMYFFKLLSNSALFTIFFILLVLLVDNNMHKALKAVLNNVAVSVFKKPKQQQII